MINTIIGKKKYDGVFHCTWINPKYIIPTKTSPIIFNVEFNQGCILRDEHLSVEVGDGTAFDNITPIIHRTFLSNDYKCFLVLVSGMNRTGYIKLMINNGIFNSDSGLPLTGGEDGDGTRYESKLLAMWDLTAPLIVSHTPSNDSTEVHTNTPLTITFNENIVKNTDVGNIKLYEKSTGTLLQTIDIRSGDVSVADNIATIATTNNLLPNAKQISVIIDGACFKDAVGNFYAGQTFEANKDDFYFSTALDAPMTVSSLTYVTKTARTMRFSYGLRSGAKALVLVKASANASAVPELNNDFSPALINGFENAIFDAEFGTTNPNSLIGTDNVNKSYTASTSVITPNLGSITRVTAGDYKALYNGTATDITISGLTASKFYRIYVLTYGFDSNGNYVFNRAITAGTISQKTNAF